MIEVMMKELGLEPRRWSDRAVGEGIYVSDGNYSNSYVSQLDDFKAFLLRAQSYTPLILSSTSSFPCNSNSSSRNMKPIIVIEDLPRVGMNNSNSKNKHDNIKKLQVCYMFGLYFLLNYLIIIILCIFNQYV